MKRGFYLFFLISISCFGQNWDMVESADQHSIGLTLGAMKRSLSPNASSIGIGFQGERFSTYHEYGSYYPWNTGYMSYKGEVGMISEGVLDGKKYLDVDLNIEAGTSSLIIFPVTGALRFMSNSDITGFEGGFGWSIGGASSDGRNFYSSIMIGLGGQTRNTFLEGVAPLEIEYDTFRQKEGTHIKSRTQKSAVELLNSHPEMFDQYKKIEVVNLFEALKSTGGFRANLQTTLIPVKSGLVSIGGRLSYLSSSAGESKIGDEVSIIQGVESEIIDGVTITRDQYLHSDALVNGSIDNDLSYKKIDLSLNLAYQTARMRIWISPNYVGENYSIVTQALNLKSTRERFSFQVGVGIRGFYER